MTQRWELKDARSGVVIAHLNATHFSKAQAARIGADIANLLNAPITQALRTGAVRNPSLAHHTGQQAFWHVVWEVNGSPMADLYTPARAQAKRITQSIADIADARMRLLDNTTLPRDLRDHPIEMHARPAGDRAPRRRNPPRLQRKARRAVAAGRFVKAQHYQARSTARGARRRELGAAAYTAGRIMAGRRRPPGTNPRRRKRAPGLKRSTRSLGPGTSSTRKVGARSRRRALSGRRASRGVTMPASGRARRNPLRQVQTLSPLAQRKLLAQEAALSTPVGVVLKRPAVQARARVLLDAWLRGVLQGQNTVSRAEVKAVWLTSLMQAAKEQRARPHSNPKRPKSVRRKVRRNPRDQEVASARRTFRRWHEFDADHATLVKAPRRLPQVMAKLGELVSVVYKSDKWAGSRSNPHGKELLYEHRTKRPRPVLATDPAGRDVFIVGGRMKPTADGLVN